MIPLAVPDLTGNEAKYLLECVETNFVSSVGPFVDRFEEGIAKATHSTAAVATSSGTSGIHLALKALDIGEGDMVIIPTYTFIASASAVAQAGAIGWLFDIDPTSWTLDPRQVARALEVECDRRGERLVHRVTGKTVRAILAVYTLGNAPDMGALRDVAKAHSLHLIADAAAAIGSEHRSRPIGPLADVSIASFNGNKTITCGGGGALFGDDLALLNRARHLATTARVGQNYDHDAIGYNYRMTNLQAAVGCAQLERLGEFLKRKSEISSFYSTLAEGLPGVEAFPTEIFGTSSHWLSGLVLKHPGDAQALIAFLNERGIGTRPFWKPIHLQVPYMHWPTDGVSTAEGLWDRVVVLPSSANASRSDLDYVAEQCAEFFLKS